LCIVNVNLKILTKLINSAFVGVNYAVSTQFEFVGLVHSGIVLETAHCVDKFDRYGCKCLVTILVDIII